MFAYYIKGRMVCQMNELLTAERADSPQSQFILPVESL